MAIVRTILLPHLEAYPVQVALFKDVTNAAFLRSQLLQANPDFDYAFLDAAMILSPLPLLLATTLSLHSTLSPATSPLRTRTPHSELVFRLHPNNNIGEAYRKFGISDETTHLIAVKLSLTPDVTNESVAEHLSRVVQGVSVPVGEDASELATFADWGRIKKVYKVNDGAVKAKGGNKGASTGQPERNKADEISFLENIIMGAMTLKGS